MDIEYAPIGARPPETKAAHRRLMIWLLIIPCLFLLPNFLKARSQGQLTACKSNTKNIATALEMYASDYGGHYPRRLERLVEKGYLKRLPTCPAAGAMTYLNYRAIQTPDSFSFACSGNNHWAVYRGFVGPSDNYPQYDAESSA